MKSTHKISLGVDIGGSHISAAAVDLATSEILSGTYFQTSLDHKLDRETILNIWTEVIGQCLQASEALPVSGIGVAVPGPFDYPNGRAMFQGNDKYESLYDVDVRKELGSRLGYPGDRIHFYNDAASFALGAALQHQVREKRVIAITLGTGFGASFLIDGLPVMSGTGVPENGCLWDKPYKDGIADDYFSTRWFLERNLSRNGTSFSGVKELLDKDKEEAEVLFLEFTTHLGEFLLPFLNHFDADALLIGGNIAKSHDFFLKPLKAALPTEKNLLISCVEQTEICNKIGASQLMALDYWARQPDLKTFF